jgi:hypothetical protein
MASAATLPTSIPLITYGPEEHPATQAKRRKMQKIAALVLHSFQLQLSDAKRLPTPLSRACILAGDHPRPLVGSGLPSPYPGTREELIRTISQTVHATVNGLDYNSLQAFLKVIKQMHSGCSFLETTMDARGEEPGSSCVGMAHIVLKQLEKAHGITGAFAARRKVGQFAFDHAEIIIECNDGYVAIDANSDPNNRIYSIPFNQTIQRGVLTFSAVGPGSCTPVIVIESFPDEQMQMFEYCTNLANGDELVRKHTMMNGPFDPETGAIPIVTYYPNGEWCKTIWVSLLRSRIILKNGTIARGEVGRTDVVPFDEMRQDHLRPRLKQLYETGEPTFHIPFETMHQQLSTFVENVELIREVFRDVCYRPSV